DPGAGPRVPEPRLLRVLVRRLQPLVPRAGPLARRPAGPPRRRCLLRDRRRRPASRDAAPTRDAGGLSAGTLEKAAAMSSTASTSPARGPGWPASLARASELLRTQAREQRIALLFTLSVVVLNLASLLGNALAFRWVAPASMGVWHTLLLVSSYLG